MARRYLTPSEALSRLNSGKGLECFLGGFHVNGNKAIRWLTITTDNAKFIANVWESLDQGDESYLDIMTFEGAHGNYDEPVKTLSEDSFETLLTTLNSEFGGVETKLLNSGMIEKDYLDYIKNERISS